MKVVIAGCGKIGTTVVQALSAEGHDVALIDRDAEVVGETANIYDVIGVVGNCTSCDALKEAGVEKAELFAALTGSDEENMLACFFARKMGARQTIARIRSPYYNSADVAFFRQQLDLSMTVNPELLAAQELYRMLKLPGAVNIEAFSGGNFELVEMKLKSDSPLDGMSLIDMRRKYSAKYLVGVVQRGEDVYIPDGSFVLKAGDKVGIAGSYNDMIKLIRMLGVVRKQAKNIMIIGCCRISYYLAKILLTGGNNVKIIDKDRDKCREFSDKLPGAVIINGDAAQQELLMEEGMDKMDAFVTLTGMDEENILLSYFAKEAGVSSVITKINREEFSLMAEKMGLDCIITPKSVVSDIFVSYARALHNSLGSKIETLYKLMDDKIEALEFVAQSDFEALNVPLKEMPIRSGILLGGIIRGRRAIVPTGDDEIHAGDKVVVFSSQSKMTDLSDILK